MTQTEERRATALLTILLMGLFMANVDVAVVNVAAPAIERGLGATGAELQLIMSGYVVSYAMLVIPGARAGRMYG